MRQFGGRHSCSGHCHDVRAAADARAKKPKRPAAVQTQQASPSLDGRTLGRMAPADSTIFNMMGWGRLTVPTAIDARGHCRRRDFAGVVCLWRLRYLFAERELRSRSVAVGIPRETEVLTVPPTPWADSVSGTMRSAVTAPMIESLTSIGPPFLGRPSLIIS
jgi:hypothetical protein